MKAIPKSTRIKVLAAVIAVVESPLLDMVETADGEGFRAATPDGRETVGDVIRDTARGLALAARGGAPPAPIPGLGAGATWSVVHALGYLTSAVAAVQDWRDEGYDNAESASRTALSGVSAARRYVTRALETVGVPDARRVERATWSDALARAKKELSGG